jgi:hypothetical protein
MDPIAFTGIFYKRILIDYFSFSPEELDKADYKFFARLWRRDMNEIIERIRRITVTLHFLALKQLAPQNFLLNSVG